MPSFDPENQDILEDEFGDMLGEVSLKHFHTKPNATQPFGASFLSWSVSVPAAIHVKRNTLIVAKTSEQISSPPPRQATTYPPTLAERIAPLM